MELGVPYGIGNPAPPSDRECIHLLHWAQDQGISYFDTAAGYGRSEELLGRAFRGRTPRPTIATKVAIHDGKSGKLLSGKDLASRVEMSLLNSRRLLGVDSLELLQIHAPGQGRFLSEELLDLMEQLSEAGQVRLWGVSTYGLDQPLHALAHAGTIRSLQVAFNLLDRAPARALFPGCTKAGVGLILRSAFLKGALTERLDALPEALAPLKKAGRMARVIADQLGLALPALALRYCASQEHAQVVLVGTADKGELAGNLEAFAAGPLPDEVLASIATIDIEDQALLNPGNWGIS